MWFLEQQARDRMQKAIDANIIPSADHMAALEARFGTDDNGVPFIMSVAGGVAQINVRGLLTQRPDWIAEFFGGGNTTYTDIITALAVAESDSSVEEAILSVDSGGGQVSGMFDAIAAIQSFSKPIRAVVGNMAASAAYGLIAPVAKIEASSRASQIGSIGIAASFGFDKDVEDVTITSTEAPDKRPDPRTEDGADTIREHLDAFHDLFVEAIADGRGTDVKDVNANFGRGRVLLAEEAMNRGMIDSVAGVAPKLAIVDSSGGNNNAASGGDNKKEGDMDLKTLLAQHPETYQAAVDIGIAKERDRVVGHMTMGASSGDMVTATAAIEDGSEMNATLQAKYLSAGMNKATLAARAGDDEEASVADGAVVGEGADEGASDEEAGARIMKLAAEQCGVTLEAE